MRLCSAKPRLPFSPLARWSPQGKEGLGCLWLPGPCCFAGGLLRWKPTPNVFSFVENQELAGKCLLGAAQAIPPQSAMELSTEAPSYPRFKTPFRSCILESSTLLGEQTTAAMRLCSAKPRWPFSPLALWSPEGTEGLGCLWLPGPCSFAGDLLSLKPTPNVFSFVERQE